MTTTLVVNGVAHVVESPAERPLLAVLRGELGITGPKLGCGEGRCGACVVRVGDECVPACRTALGEVGGRPVTTVEGLLRDGRLHPAQQAWLEVGALQCGFCTPGWVVETAALIDRRPRPPEAEMLAALERHLCRCCAYPRIRRALRRAVELADGTASPGLTVTAEQVADRLVARVTPESPEIDGPPHRTPDARVGAAAAEVPLQGREHLRLRRSGPPVDERRGLDDPPRGAEPALERPDLEPRLLSGMKPAVAGKPLHRGNRASPHLAEGGPAGGDALVAHPHHAGAAPSLAAAELRPRDPELVAQHGEQGTLGGGLHAVRDAVHDEGRGHPVPSLAVAPVRPVPRAGAPTWAPTCQG